MHCVWSSHRQTRSPHVTIRIVVCCPPFHEDGVWGVGVEGVNSQCSLFQTPSVQQVIVAVVVVSRRHLFTICILSIIRVRTCAVVYTLDMLLC